MADVLSDVAIIGAGLGVSHFLLETRVLEFSFAFQFFYLTIK